MKRAAKLCWRPLGRQGFSLIEVTIAILMVSVGLLTLFALFPLGLRESDMAIVDTHEAMFADSVLSALEGNAMGIKRPLDWNEIEAFIPEVTKGLAEALGTGIETFDNWRTLGGDPPRYEFAPTNASDVIPWPRTPADMDGEAAVREIRFSLVIADDGRRKKAELKVKSGRYGRFELGQTYFSEFIYLGM